MLTSPDIDPVAIQFGPLQIHWYGLMYLGGILGAWWLTRRRAQTGLLPNWTNAQVDDLTFYIALGVILGGRLGSILFYSFPAFVSDPLTLLRIWEGGMSFHGGFLGVLFALWIYARRHKRTWFELTDIAAPVVPIGLGLGRLGNFINAELWGKPTDAPWGIVYEGVARHPSQLYEFFLEGVVMFTVLWIYTSKPRPRMAASAWFVILYGVFRTAVEFVRLPDAHIGYLAFGWLTMGQVLSIPMIILGLVILWFVHKPVRSAG